LKCLLDSNYLKKPSGQSRGVGLFLRHVVQFHKTNDIRQIKVMEKYMTILYNYPCRQSLTLRLRLSRHRYRTHRSTTFPSHSSWDDDLTAPVDRRCNPRDIEVPILGAFGAGRSSSPSLQAVWRLRRTGSLCLVPGAIVIIVDVLTEMRGRTTGTRVAVKRCWGPTWLEYLRGA